MSWTSPAYSKLTTKYHRVMASHIVAKARDAPLVGISGGTWKIPGASQNNNKYRPRSLPPSSASIKAGTDYCGSRGTFDFQTLPQNLEQRVQPAAAALARLGDRESRVQPAITHCVSTRQMRQLQEKKSAAVPDFSNRHLI
ncbi:hypothetical protein AJ78_05120 [Emergomyces pasteurianus Ep9510]|uniref:Uncharacterized protein n=1 Tax=Emergomyces pasteurianus Ep9510 TaxID=1447872 RepID=A0A1J9Q2W1_9EURO|nr:hypothetical protein AJ78_05120 [Emergomyces pasteurianus Ep9510]